MTASTSSKKSTKAGTPGKTKTNQGAVTVKAAAANSSKTLDAQGTTLGKQGKPESKVNGTMAKKKPTKTDTKTKAKAKVTPVETLLNDNEH